MTAASLATNWFGELPTSWTYGNIRRFARMKTGHTPSRNVPEYWENTTIPWFTLADVWQLRDGRQVYLGETTAKISKVGLANSAAELLPSGTVVFSRTASVGFSGIMPIAMATSQDFWNWICGESLLPKYLLYIFRSMQPHLRGLMMGSTHKTIYQTDAASLSIPVPPIDTQRLIVAYLDSETGQIDNLIDKQNALIELLGERRKAVITRVVTKGLDLAVQMKDSGVEWLGDVPAHWVIQSFKFAADILPGYSFPSESFSDDTSSIRLLRGINVGLDRTNWTESVYWASPISPTLAEYRLHAGDIVLGLDRPVISGGVRVTEIGVDDLPALLVQRVARIRSRAGATNAFLRAVLMSQGFASYLEPIFTGVSVPHLSTDQVGAFQVALPPVAEQQMIYSRLARDLDVIAALVDKSEAIAARLIERRSALITAAVTGKIDARGKFDGAA